jgi:hypothetical protein
LISDAIWLGIWLVVAAVVVLGLKTRPGWAVVGMALGILGVYVLVLARMGIPEERSHLIEYGIVAILIHEALQERAAGGRHVPKPALLAMGVTAVVGTVDEIIQALLPNRVFDVRDIAFNAAAAAMAVTATAAATSAKSATNNGRCSTMNHRRAPSSGSRRSTKRRRHSLLSMASISWSSSRVPAHHMLFTTVVQTGCGSHDLGIMSVSLRGDECQWTMTW